MDQKRGFSREKLMVIPPDTELPPNKILIPKESYKYNIIIYIIIIILFQYDNNQKL